jgi:DNA-3-methyladenine glycosylase II
VRLGFLVDDWSGHVGVVLRQDSGGTVRGQIVESTAAAPGRVHAQAARIHSLDHDATGYAAIGDRDPVVGELQRASGWLRPVLFHSPYEAACWAVISSRLRHSVAARVRDRIAAERGGSLRVKGTEHLTFPAPEQLLALSSVE